MMRAMRNKYFPRSRPGVGPQDVIKCPAGGFHRSVHIRFAGARDLGQLLLGGRVVNTGKILFRDGRNELAVNERFVLGAIGRSRDSQARARNPIYCQN